MKTKNKFESPLPHGGKCIMADESIGERSKTNNMKTGIELIAEERQRQIEKEGWTKEHDAVQSRGELLDAARCYIIASDACHYSKNNDTFKGGYRPGEGTPDTWPWEEKYWKPTGDPVRDLVKAGALIAAEIDRIQK